MAPFRSYWDDRDGDYYEGWWVADGVGSQNYFAWLPGKHERPDDSKRYQKGQDNYFTMEWVKTGSGYSLDGCGVLNGEYKLDAEQTNHGYPIYARKGAPGQGVLTERCEPLLSVTVRYCPLY